MLKMLPIWKLLGFILYIVLYFNILEAYERRPPPSFKSLFFKVMPVVHLILVVISTSSEDFKHTKTPVYRRNIIFGLLMSVAASLVLRYFFKLGMLLFGMAHIFYILAFGLRPVGSGPMAASFGVIAASTYMYITADMKAGFDMKVFILLYLVVIFTMAWRATAQFVKEVTLENFCACAGAIVFIASDVIIATDEWKGSFHLAPFWILITYYLAQLGIAMSACNSLGANFYQHIVKKE